MIVRGGFNKNKKVSCRFTSLGIAKDQCVKDCEFISYANTYIIFCHAFLNMFNFLFFIFEISIFHYLCIIRYVFVYFLGTLLFSLI